MTNKQRALAAVRALKEEYPDAQCSLRAEDPFELLVATILSAQCADEREKIRQLRRIACLRTRLENRTGRSLQLGEDGEYYGRVVDRLSTPRR